MATLLQKFVSGGLPALLDVPEKAATANDADVTQYAQAAPVVYAERYEPTSIVNTTASRINNSVPGGFYTVGVLAVVSLVSAVALLRS